MAYRWSLEGPAFEFPTPYGTENGFLAARGYALIGFALLIVLVVSFVGGEPENAPIVSLEKLPEPASAVPHLLAAMLLALLGARDLWKAAAQRLLLLAPGQPASLMSEVPREGSGASPGAPALQRLLAVGDLRHAEPSGPYEAGLGWLGPDLAAAPTTLHAYLRVRFSHLALVAGLSVVLLLLMLGLATPSARGLAALVPIGVCAAVLARHALQPLHAALPPWAVALLVALALAAGGALGGFADRVPRADAVPRLGLPIAAGVMLGSVLLFEALGVLAARAQLQQPWLLAVAADEARVAYGGTPEQLLRDVDLELHRQWTEGIPNRRYAWRLALPEREAAAATGATDAGFEAVVLEESQPLVAHSGRNLAPATPQAPARVRGLWALDLAGLLWSTAGGVLWVWLAWAHMKNPTASWLPGAAGLVGLVVGGYALRVGHLLWSRTEVLSTLTWLDFQGRCVSASDATAEAGRGRSDTALRVDGVTLQARVATVTSMFYAAAPHGPGSRTLLALAAPRGGAGAWVQALQEFARQAEAAAPAAATPATRAKAAVRAPDAETPLAPRRTARFCGHCGTPLLAGARFCQQCGSSVEPA